MKPLALLLGLGVLALPAGAAGAQPDAGATTAGARGEEPPADPGDVATLEAELDDAHASLTHQLEARASLAASDCVTACRALGSIERAAGRICELAPGPRCDAARAKATDATQRVRAACPGCVVAGAPEAQDPTRAASDEAPRATAASEDAPAGEVEGRGGCRSCDAVGAGAPGLDGGWLFLAALLAGRLGRRRR